MSQPYVTLRPAVPEDAAVAGELIYMTMSRVADYLFDNASTSRTAIGRLFAVPGSRFRYTFSTVAQVETGVVGLILAAPMVRLQKTRGRTFRGMCHALGILACLRVVYRSLWLVRVPEGRAGDFYVAHLAVLPAFQGQGIGRRLLHWAEKEARRTGCARVSLTVEIGHTDALRFYIRQGYCVERTVRTPLLERRFGYPGVHVVTKVLLGQQRGDCQAP